MARSILIPSSTLTAREVEVVQLLSQGLQMKEVAERLGIALKTAETHMTHIREKKGMPTAAGVVGAAFRAGEVK